MDGLPHITHHLSTMVGVFADSIGVVALKDRIKDALEANKGTMDEKAKKLGVSRSALYKWLDGNTKNLKLENLFALSGISGLSAEWIATGRGTKQAASALTHSTGPDLSFLTITLHAVEEYLDSQGLTLEPEAKAKVVTILYELCVDKGRVEQPAVARILRLVA